MEMSDETWHLVTNTPGVSSFIGTTSGPQPLEQMDIDRILGRIERKPSKERPEIPYQVGEQVRVIDGPFTGFAGLIDEVDAERGKVTGTPVGCACGDGVIDWARVIGIIRNCPRDIVMSVECGTIEQAERSIKHLKQFV